MDFISLNFLLNIIHALKKIENSSAINIMMFNHYPVIFGPEVAIRKLHLLHI